MKILVLTQQYPSEKNLYRNMFVHNRIKGYMDQCSELDVQVFVLNNAKYDYSFEGVEVIQGNQKALRNLIFTNSFDKIIVHFLTFQMVPVLLETAQEIEKIIWVHGYEAIKWQRRIFNANSIRFLKYIIGNKVQLHFFKKFVSKGRNYHFVFVSEWMRQVANEDSNRKIDNYSVIPNGINTRDFCFTKKSNNMRYKVLLIRPFNSRKYATDIATEAIYKYSLNPSFYKFDFTVIGEGKYFSKDTEKIKEFKNVHLVNKFLNKDEIMDYHKKNGVFLCPTRQDAQGVSMCEAMSDGLVPIASNNTAIPEFLSEESGFLTSSVQEIVEAFSYLDKFPEDFSKMSLSASQDILKKCDSKSVLKTELNLILKGNE